MNLMDTIKQEKNRGYVIAGGAAIIAFIAFFLPYVSILGFLSGNVPVSASGSSLGGWLWFEFLGVLVVIAVSAVFLFGSSLLSGTVNMPIDQQIKYGKYLLLGGSILALLIHLLFLLSYSAWGVDYVGVNPAYSAVIHVSLDFGYWLFMLAAIAMVVGSVLAYRNPAVAQTYGQQYAAQSAQYPPPPTQYPPYQQPYPDQQPQQPYSPYQQPYAPAEQQPQQSYPSYQQPYPPVEQQPQHPYLPYQQSQQSQQYPPTEMQPPTQQR